MHKSFIDGLSEKIWGQIFWGQMGHLGPRMSAVRIVLQFCTM